MNTNDPQAPYESPSWQIRSRIYPTMRTEDDKPSERAPYDPAWQGADGTIYRDHKPTDEQMEEAMANSIGVNDHGPFIKPTERAPLFTSEELCKAVAGDRDALPMAEFNAIGIVMNMFEAKITSGELITKEEHEIALHNAAFDAREEEAERRLNDTSADV